MKFIDTLLEAVSTKVLNPQFIEDVQKEKRYNERFRLMPDDPITAKILGKDARVVDISYGGLALHVPGKHLPKAEAFKNATEIEVISLDKSMKCPSVNVRDVTINEMGAFVAYEFRHKEADSLIFMKEIIEPIYNGKSIYQVAQEKLAEPYSLPNWKVYRGDGPTDILAEYDEEQTNIIKLLMTFTFNGACHEVLYRDGKISTNQIDKGICDGHDFEQAGNGKKSAKADRTIIKECLAIILGIEPDIREDLEGFVSTILGWFAKGKKAA